MKKNYPNYTICDTTFTDYDYADYVEDCECNDREPQGENSNDFWEWVSEMQELEYDDMRENLKYSKEANVPCLLIGSCGLWNGRRAIMPYRFENVLDAIDKCSNNMDYLKVEVKDGHLDVYAYHHDGTNCFEIHKLSKKGIKATENWDGCGDKEEKPYWLAKWHDYIY